MLKSRLDFLLLILILHKELFINATQQARETPFCVDGTNEDLHNFQPIFNYFERNPQEVVHVAETQEVIEEEPEFILSIAHGLIPKHKPPYEHRYKDFKVTFSRMNSKPVPPKEQLFNLRQWFHIHVHSDVPLRGLYAQSISSPLGIPFGEFRADFNCFDCRSEGNFYKVKDSEIEIVPCRFRSFHSYKHPHVVVIGGKSSVTPFFDAHFHFNWFEASCQHAPFLQFLFVAVNEWEQIPDGFDAFYSQVINNTIPDSTDGTASPFYIDFDENMGCHGAPELPEANWTVDMIRQFDPLKARPHNKLHSRLVYNKDYDDCVKNDGIGGDGNNRCPPGPFRCVEADGTSLPYKNVSENVKRRIDISSKNTYEVCPSCFDTYKDHNDEMIDTASDYGIVQNDMGRRYNPDQDDTDIQMQSLEGIAEIELEFWMNGNYTNELIHKVHGTLMIFAWITCPLISNYLARFYKESGHGEQGFTYANVGFWLWGHIALSYSSLAAMWGGLGILIFYDQDCEPDIDGQEYGCSDSNHQIPAVIAMGMFHIQHLNGWCRPLGTSIRKLYVLWHVLFGYGAQILAVISFLLLTNTVPIGITISVVLALVIGLLFYGLSTYLQRLTDKSLHLEVKREIFPVPESIEVIEDVPYASARALFLILFVLIQIVIITWVIITQTLG